MKLGVLSASLASKPVEEMLSYLSGLGVEAVELGTGGYTNDAHTKPEELLADKAGLEAQMKRGAEEASYYARRTMSKIRKKLEQKAEKKRVSESKSEKQGRETAIKKRHRPERMKDG